MSEDNQRITDIQAAIEAGKEIGSSAKIHEYNDIPFAILPKGMAMQEMTSLMHRPQRIKQIITTETAVSFIDYFNEFATDHSMIFCDVDAAKFKGIIDYHADKDTPAWGDHRVTFTAKPTQEWESWNKNNGVKMSQVDFAFFIENNRDEIRGPDPAQMLEIALTLKAKTKLTFESGHRLNDGQVQFQYREDMDGGAGVKGDIKIPETFTLGMRVFEGGDAYEMEARFRYRIKEGQVLMWYDLVRPHKIHRAAVEDIYARIKEQAKARLVLHGEP